MMVQWTQQKQTRQAHTGGKERNNMWQNRKYHYEYYLIKVETPTGVYTQEIKAKNEAGARKQIEKLANKSNSQENLNKPYWEREPQIKNILWDTLTLDRTGFVR